MSLLKMRLIVLIDRFKQVTAVAKALGLKQPTVSFHMKKMETEWGVRLFEAKAGRIFLTKAGKMILPYASQIIELHTEAEAKVSELRAYSTTRVRIGCTDCALTTLTRSNWLTSLAKKEEARVTLETGEERTLYANLHSGLFDLVMCGSPPPESLNIRYDLVLSSSLKLVVPANHFLARKAEVSMQDVLNLSYINHVESSVNDILASWQSQPNPTNKVNAAFQSVDMILSAVHAGLGAAILPQCVVAVSDDRFAVMDLPIKLPEWNLYASWKPNNDNVPLLQQLYSSVSLENE